MNDSPRLSTRLLVRIGLIIAALASACATRPRSAPYFDCQTSFNALNGFAYAVETEDWDFAHECLTEQSREQLSKARMFSIIRDATAPNSDVSIHDLIVQSDRKRMTRETLKKLEEELGPGIHPYALEYDDASLDVYVVRRAPSADEASEGIERWEIDLLRTVTARGIELD